MSDVIRFDRVCKRYGTKQALDNVSFEVPAGVVFAILGENGAGKTTAIRAMLGLETIQDGKIEVLGLSPKKEAEKIRRAIGYVSDQPTLYNWMTVREMGWFAAGFYPDGYQGHFETMCEQFELDLSVKIKNLSKGMRAKVALSLAMSHQPDLLILDEPTSGLDTMVRRRFLESMIDIAAAGRTVFLSSHQILEVERVADYVAIIHRGKLLICESLDSLKTRLERWTVTLNSASDSLQIDDAVILYLEKQQRMVQLVLSNPPEDLLWKLRDAPQVAGVQVDVPSLEDIFVMLVHREENCIELNQPSTDLEDTDVENEVRS